MTLDLIDRAFLAHFAHDDTEPATTALPDPAVASITVPVPMPPSPSQSPSTPARGASLLDRLLATVPREWRRMADEVEAACRAGCRVIAVTGSHPREGRTTLARGLVGTLSARGHRVILLDKPPLEIPDGQDGGGPVDIVIVDAGIWFPEGSFQRHVLARQAFGCDAAILVSRADRARCCDCEESLAAIGLHVVGEVITFSPPFPDGDPEQQHARDP